MDNLKIQAEQALGKLLKADEDQLYAQLGIRTRAIVANPAAAGSFEPLVAHNEAEMGPMDDVREFGHRLFNRWNREAHSLVCGTNSSDTKDREGLLAAFGGGELALGAVLAGLLVANLGLSPALSAVIAALVIKRFFRPTYEEFCQAWGEKLL